MFNKIDIISQIHPFIKLYIKLYNYSNIPNNKLIKDLNNIY